MKSMAAFLAAQAALSAAQAPPDSASGFNTDVATAVIISVCSALILVILAFLIYLAKKNCK